MTLTIYFVECVDELNLTVDGTAHSSVMKMFEVCVDGNTLSKE